MTQHTPGPWTLLNHAYPLIVRGKDARSSQSIAYGSAETTQVMQTGMSVEEVWANARLMAAAPDMLEQLESCLAYVKKYYKTLPDDGAEQDFLMCSVIYPAEETINKARGL